MSELRQRQVGPDSSSKTDKSDVKKSQRSRNGGGNRGISFLDVIRVLVTLVVASCGLSYYMTASESYLWGYRPWYTRWPVLVRYLKGPLQLTPDQLSLYNGSNEGLPIYLSINGTLFDVSANPLVYGPGGHYNFFTGRDATRAFVTGCFQEDLTPSLYGVEEMFMPIDEEADLEKMTSGERKIQREQDLRLARTKVRNQVLHWQNFFRNHQKYFEVGQVVGLEELRKEKRELCRPAKQQRQMRKTEDE